MAIRRSARLSTGSAAKVEPESFNLEKGPVPVKSTKKRSKAAEDSKENADGFTKHSTPKRKRVVPPKTPTPAAASAMAIPYSSADIGDSPPPPPPKNRLAAPHLTNAPLISPQTSRLISNPALDDISPSKASSMPDRSTAGEILEKAIAHLLKVEPRLQPVVEQHQCHVFSPEGLSEEIDPFRSLASGIIGQQVSGSAAKAMKNKFVALFNSPPAAGLIMQKFPTPAQVAVTPIPTLRTAGLSQRKAEYIQGLAEKFVSGELSTDMLMNGEYHEVFEKLIAVRGLGKWSVEMFACFGLKRMDVFSTGDLGVQRGMAALLGKDVSKLKAKGGGKWKYMSEKDMLEMAEKFAPYRSIFMWYMWRVEEVDVSMLEN
ncbi:MAG: 3-methyladenine DNA glycosylase [Claussenomyces sp. TS43310]|nr:MAG: 3-methyladenine DNA glycosylase [Claussenomyces sp. TS43310]